MTKTEIKRADTITEARQVAKGLKIAGIEFKMFAAGCWESVDDSLKNYWSATFIASDDIEIKKLGTKSVDFAHDHNDFGKGKPDNDINTASYSSDKYAQIVFVLA